MTVRWSWATSCFGTFRGTQQGTISEFQVFEEVRRFLKATNDKGDKHETVQKDFEPRLIGFTRLFASRSAVTEIRLGAQRAGAPLSVP